MLEDFISQSNLIYNNFYDYSLVSYKNNKSKIKIICPIHGTFEKTPVNHLQGQGCPKCSLIKRSFVNRKDKNKLLEEFKNIHDNKYDYSLVNYINTNTKVKIICENHGIFEQTPKCHINGNGCPKCAIKYKSKNLAKSKEEFINISNIKHNNFYNYDKVNYKNNKLKILIICPEHGEFKMTPSHHMNGHGCSKCAGNYKKSNSEFIKECNIQHNNKYDYSLTKYKNSKTKVKIVCSEHGIFEQNSQHHLNGVGCPKCNSSKGEKEIRKVLEKYNINFTEQKRFKECRNKKSLPFDFYLNDLNLCIEFDGIYHYKPIKSEKNFLETKNNDKIKNNYCKSNNIKLKRISYKKINKIEDILKKLLYL